MLTVLLEWPVFASWLKTGQLLIEKKLSVEWVSGNIVSRKDIAHNYGTIKLPYTKQSVILMLVDRYLRI